MNKNNRPEVNSIIALNFGSWPTFHYRVDRVNEDLTLTMLRRGLWGGFGEKGTIQVPDGDGLGKKMVGRAGERGAFRRVKTVAS